MPEQLSGMPQPRRADIADCWNKIGVRGDASCPALAEQVHCRNCPTYASAARRLLDREVDGEYLSQWADRFAQEKQAVQADSHSALIVRIGAQWLALATAVLDEVAECRPVHPLPHRRGNIVLGLVNVRGELLVCVSLSKLLNIGMEPNKQSGCGGSGRLVVIRHDGGRLAFPVDEVQTCQRYAEHELRPPPATIAKSGVAHTKRILWWRTKMVACLDTERVLNELNESLACHP